MDLVFNRLNRSNRPQDSAHLVGNLSLRDLLIAYVWLTSLLLISSSGWAEVSAQSPAQSPAQSSTEPPQLKAEAPHTQWQLSIGVRPDISSWGAGGGGELGVAWPLSPRFTLDACGRSGYLARSGDDEGLYSGPDPDLLYLALAFGPTWRHALSARWWLRLGARVTHIHHASLASWGGTPWSNLAGDSSGGVLHRSGLELVIGVTGGEVFTLKGRRAQWDVTLNLGRLPSSVELRVHAGLALGLRL